MGQEQDTQGDQTEIYIYEELKKVPTWCDCNPEIAETSQLNKMEQWDSEQERGLKNQMVFSL